MDPLLDTDAAGEPSAGDPLTERETQIEPDRLEKLGESLAGRRDEWVTARTTLGIEKRWMEDVDQYHGRDEANRQAASMMETAEYGGPMLRSQAKPQRSTVFVNITRPKTNAAEARLANMLYPTDDKNWGIKPTPIPMMAKTNGQSALGQPLPSNVTPIAQAVGADPSMQQQQPIDPAQQQPAATSNTPNDPVMDEAIKKAKAMSSEIEDALNECGYNAEGRLLLHDCAVLGTGILKGPIVVNRVRKAWIPQSDANGTVHVLEIVKEKKPASERVDPWNVFPDPLCGEDVHNGRGLFERKLYSAKQLRDLAKQPGYLKANIEAVLEEGPQTEAAKTVREQRENKEGKVDNKSQFELWEYWGEFEPKDLIAAGVDGIDESSVASLSGCVIIVNSQVIKGFLNPIETGDIPYDFMPWERVDGSCWGYGVPRLMRPAQRVLNAAWRQLMDNSGLSVGPQIVLKRGLIKPVDDKWEITGRKLWDCTDESADVRQAFQIFEVNGHQQEITGIIELALKFADEESSIPMITQGEKGAAPDTVGGMTILMNSANVVLQRMVKMYDDYITKRHITRYYDWMMAYSDNPDIKGDFQVDARGSSALLVRDMQSQAILQFGQFQGSAIISPMVNWENWIKEVLKTQHIDYSDILKSEDEIKQLANQPPQPSPDQIKAQTAVQVAQINSQAKLETVKIETSGEQQYAHNELLVSQQAHEGRMQELQLQRELEILKYANQNKVNLDSIKADLAKVSMIEGTKRQLAGLDQQAQQVEQQTN